MGRPHVLNLEQSQAYLVKRFEVIDAMKDLYCFKCGTVAANQNKHEWPTWMPWFDSTSAWITGDCLYLRKWLPLSRTPSFLSFVGVPATAFLNPIWSCPSYLFVDIQVGVTHEGNLETSAGNCQRGWSMSLLCWASYRGFSAWLFTFFCPVLMFWFAEPFLLFVGFVSHGKRPF